MDVYNLSTFVLSFPAEEKIADKDLSLRANSFISINLYRWLMHTKHENNYFIISFDF